jgi:hypothetical protein
MTPEEVDVFHGSPDSDWLCRLAVLKEDGWPFVTPMWYQWRDDSFRVVGRKRSAWVQDLIREPRCFVCIDEAAMPPAGGLRKVLARCRATVVEGPVVAEGSQWVGVADEMAGRYSGEAGREGLKFSYGWERYLVRLDPEPDGMTTWQGVGWAKRYLDDKQRAEFDALLATMAAGES